MNRPRRPRHPGVVFRKIILEASGIEYFVLKDLSSDLEIEEQKLHSILWGNEDVTPEIADKLGKYRGESGESWLNMQKTLDEWKNKGIDNALIEHGGEA